MILYEGPSALDNNDDIICIATGTHNPSRNGKTGAMVQIWVLRKNCAPARANKLNLDDSICGDCKHRQGSCFVNLGQGPNAVWKAYHEGKYEKVKVSDAVRNRKVRLTAYGDPAALPPSLVYKLIKHSDGHTGYTHQWHKPVGQFLKGHVMASVDTIDEYNEAKKQGWTTFRVFDVPEGFNKKDVLQKREQYCPSKLFTISCLDCMKCDGKNGDVCIKIHGAQWKQNRYKNYLKNIPRTVILNPQTSNIKHQTSNSSSQI